MNIRDMKQTDLVEKTGISKGALSSYISGKYEPKQTNTFKIAQALNVDVSWLMGNDVPIEPKNTPGGMPNNKIGKYVTLLRSDEQLQQLVEDFTNLDMHQKDALLNLLKVLKKQEG